MKFYISYFYNIRFFPSNYIVISTAMWDPKWISEKSGNGKYYFLNENNVVLGIKEESLIFNEKLFENIEEKCQKDCPYKNKVPNCDFMINYEKQLRQIDFKNYLLPEFERIADEVRKITHYKGDPLICLMVHEKPDVECSERPILKKVFKDNGIELKEWTKEELGDIF